MRRRPSPLLTLLLALILTALPASALCRSYRPPASSQKAPQEDEAWTLQLTHLAPTRFTAQPYVANGYLGARLPAVGVGFQSYSPRPEDPESFGQGWPLFGPRVTSCMVAGFYDVQEETRGTNFAQEGGEQVVSLLPYWPVLFVTLQGYDGQVEATYGPGINTTDVREWRQSMSIRNGVVTTEAQWAPAGLNMARPITLRYTVLAHRDRPTLAMMKVDVRDVPAGLRVVLTDALDGQGAARIQAPKAGRDAEARTLHASVEPLGLADVHAHLFSSLQLEQHGAQASSLPPSAAHLLNTSHPATATQSFLLPDTPSFTAWKAVGIASTDAFAERARGIALASVRTARKTGWKELLAEHVQAWEAIWEQGGDIVIHGAETEEQESSSLLSRLQTQARASLFHLLANVRRGDEGAGLGDNSLAPSGLTSDSYAGSIFWDAETFMFPSLSLLYPEYAESILNYRHRAVDQLARNAQQYGKPGILNPWVAARYQNCTGIGPCYDYEYHLNNDIALAHWQYYEQTRNQTFLERLAWPIMKGVSQFWASQVVHSKGPANDSEGTVTGQGRYETLNLTDPDEYANFKNNGAFTNAGLTTVMLDTLKAAHRLGYSLEDIGAQNWSDVALHTTILRDKKSNVVLEYEGFNASVEVKQADVPLLVYPLSFADQFPKKEPSPRSDLDYYSGATSPNGPGMTYSMYGIASVQLDGREPNSTSPNCVGFTRLLQAGMPYEREFAQFSEQVDDDYSSNGGTNPAYTFLTGHGGYLQSYTHGLLGYRARNDSDHTLYIDPNLPPQLTSDGGITIRGLHHGRSRVDVTIKEAHTTVTHRTGECALTLQAGPYGKKHKLGVGQTSQVATRTVSTMTSHRPNHPHNYALCHKVFDSADAPPANASSRVHAGTNFAQAANDGSNATYFQAARADVPTSLVVDLGRVHSLHSMHLNFGALPPHLISASIARNTAPSTMKDKPIVDRLPIRITQPYNSSHPPALRLPSTFNTTDILLSKDGRRVQARYVNITMQGVATPQEDTGYGATLLEVALY